MADLPYGVASGDVTTGSVTLWSWLHGHGTVEVCVSLDDADVWKIVETVDEPGPRRWHVSGLQPGTAYRYRVRLGASTRAGVFRTLPTHGELKFAVVSCAKFNSGYFNAYARIAERNDLDFVLHLGDYIYEAGDTPLPGQAPGAGIGRTFDPVHACVSYEDYTRRYAQYRSDPDVQALHARHAVWATLDDHELADNAFRHGAEAHDVERDGPWEDRQEAALLAWHDWLPTMRRPGDGDRVWTSIEVPGIATIALLETRLDRDGPEVASATRSALGRDQAGWLAATAAGTDTPWIVVASPSMLTPMHGMEFEEDATWALRKLKLRSLTEDAPYHDLWDSFGSERDAVLRSLIASPATPLILSGDVHVSVASRPSVDGVTVGPEWVTSSVTSPNLDDKCGWEPRTRSLHYEASVKRVVEAIRWCDFDSHGYMIVTVSSSRAAAEWWAVDTVLQPSDSAQRVHEDTWTRGEP